MPPPIPQIGRRLPRGWLDLLLQFGLFFAVYQCYQVVRGLSEAREAVAVANAEWIIGFERTLGLYFEPGLQQTMLQFTWVIDFVNFWYVNSHFVITTTFLAWLYLRRHDHFYFVRNMFMVAMLLALVGYVLMPTAPPRLMPGFVDTVAVFTPLQQDSNAVSLLVNKYAAVPSMHIGFSSIIGTTAFLLVRNPVGKAVWATYPLVVLFTIMVTGNHYWFDAAAGAAVAASAAFVAHRLLAPIRPEQWAFRPATA